MRNRKPKLEPGKGAPVPTVPGRSVLVLPESKDILTRCLSLERGEKREWGQVGEIIRERVRTHLGRGYPKLRPCVRRMIGWQ
jgi:hypothetical protein